jgi:hypothetical protein
MSHHPRRALGYDTGWRPSRAVRPDRGTLVVALPAEAQQSSLGYHGIVRLYGRAQLPRQSRHIHGGHFTSPLVHASAVIYWRHLRHQYRGDIKRIDRNVMLFFRSFTASYAGRPRSLGDQKRRPPIVKGGRPAKKRHMRSPPPLALHLKYSPRSGSPPKRSSCGKTPPMPCAGHLPGTIFRWYMSMVGPSDASAVNPGILISISSLIAVNDHSTVRHIEAGADSFSVSDFSVLQIFRPYRFPSK